MQSKLTELDAILKEICVRYFYVIIIILLCFSIYYIHENLKPLNYIVTMGLFFHVLIFFIPYKLSYKSIKSLIPIYLGYISFFLFANVIYFWSLNQITAFMWYSIIPVAVMIFFNRKTVILWSIYVLIHICSLFIIVPFIPEGYFERPSNLQLTVINIMTIISSISFIIFFISYLNKINLIKGIALYENELNTEIIDHEDVQNTEMLKFEDLYIDILNYFAEKRPYCDPNFTIVQLAKDLNSNVKYVSRIIKIKEDVNFSVFINMHRINLIKALIAKDYHNKYTIRYIYTTAGFRHQSTFNKVFKEIEGITPSEYIKSNQEKNSI